MDSASQYSVIFGVLYVLIGSLVVCGGVFADTSVTQPQFETYSCTEDAEYMMRSIGPYVVEVHYGEAFTLEYGRLTYDVGHMTDTTAHNWHFAITSLPGWMECTQGAWVTNFKDGVYIAVGEPLILTGIAPSMTEEYQLTVYAFDRGLYTYAEYFIVLKVIP